MKNYYLIRCTMVYESLVVNDSDKTTVTPAQLRAYQSKNPDVELNEYSQGEWTYTGKNTEVFRLTEGQKIGRDDIAE